MFPFKTIRGKTTLAMTLVGLLPVLLLIGISATRTVDRMKEERRARHTAVTREISRHVTGALLNAKGDLISLASNPILIGDRVAEGERRAELVRLQRRGFTSISLLDDQGFIVQSTVGSDHVQEYSPWFRHARETREPTVSSPFLTSAGAGLQISIFLPADEIHTGVRSVSVVRATISFDRIVEILAPVQIGAHAKLALVDQSGNVLFSSQARELLGRWDESLPPSFWSESPGGSYTDPLGERFSYVRAAVLLPDQIGSQREWSLIWFEEASDIEAEIVQIYLSHVFAALFALSLAVGIGLLVSHRLARPIMKLRQFSEQISQGNLEAELNVGTTNELGDLAATMVKMGQEIKESRRQLKLSLVEQAKRREEEILVREIHHRVKNNLQIIASLFRMNLRRVKGDEAKQVIVESESRLRTMSLLHDAMHRSGDVGEIGIGGYLRAVANHLVQQHRQRSGEQFVLDVRASERSLGIDTALPCGLIVNELVAHCLREGLPTADGQIPRTIGLNFEAGDDGRLILSVMHVGSARNSSEPERFSASLSYKLVSLMADQLGGQLETVWGEEGFVGRVWFDESRYSDRVGSMEAPMGGATPEVAATLG